MVLGVYPGSFDPVTVGHVDVVRRASSVFEKVIVAVYGGSSKNLLFDADERVDLFERSVGELTNVEVTKFEGLVVRFAKEVGAKVIIRGLRSGSDFEYEFDMAFMNRRLEPDLDMVFFMTSQEYMFVSSSLLKEVAQLHGDIEAFLPPHVTEALKIKYGLPVSKK